MRPNPDWLVVEPFDDVELGILKTGKEAQVDLAERIGSDGTTCLVAKKRYLPREVKNKGELEAAGFQRSSAFRHDVEYREGRQFRRTRDRRAVEAMTRYGKRLLQDRWTDHEFRVMSKLWQAGMSVPYPIAFDDDVLELEYIGDRSGAAPQLHAARLSGDDLDRAFVQLVDSLRILVATGYAHGDLSPYNVLWWDDRLWFIDFPQAVDIAANPQGIHYLNADIANICTWFRRRGVDADPDELFADVLAFL